MDGVRFQWTALTFDMEYYDLAPVSSRLPVTKLDRITIPPFVHFLDDKLWQGTSFSGRSAEITPLFIARHRDRNRGFPVAGSHVFWELTCVLSGSERLLGDFEIDLPTHAICLIPPKVMHREFSETAVDTVWIAFRGKRMPCQMFTQPRVVHSKMLAHMIEHLWLFASGTFGPTGPELDAQTANVVSRFLRLLAEGNEEQRPDGIQRAMDHILAHYDEPLNMAEVARKFGYSEGYFYRSFKKRVGVAPNTYLIRVRMQQAVRILKAGTTPVNEVAREVGITDPLYFSRLFKRTTGLSPRQFREKQQREEPVWRGF